MFAKRKPFALFPGIVFYRAFVGAIILFWFWMTLLLVRSTWFSRFTEPVDVPTAYLWKLVFLHEESSDLVLYNQRQRLGNLHLEPHRRVVSPEAGKAGVRRITAVGGFTLDLPWTGHQNILLHGSADFGAGNEVTRLRGTIVFNVSNPTGPGTTVMLDGSPSADQWHYIVRRGQEQTEEKSGTLAELLNRPELQAVGIDPATLFRWQAEGRSKVTFTARRGKLRTNQDEVETYVVTVKDGNGLESTLHLNPFGQVLAVRIFTGLSLLDGSLNP